MRRGATLAVWLASLALAAASALPASAGAEQAAQPGSPAAGTLDVGRYHTCAVLPDANVRCWGYGGDGALGYASTVTIGDDETPAAAGPVDLGAGRTALALSAGAVHTCALLDDGAVRCWGFGGDGRLGDNGTYSVGDDEPPSAIDPVDLGDGRTARAITAGRASSCAVLDDGAVRCWGFGFDGRLGYGDTRDIGDDETPGSVGPVNLGAGRTAVAITGGDAHTCALLDNGAVRCWGFGGNGQLGYGNTTTIGDDETPDSVGPVKLGTGRTAVALSAGDFHTCALLDDGAVRCWGYGGNGRLGYANTQSVGDDETPAVAGPVDLGAGRRAVAIAAGADHTCAVLDDGTVRCWGYGSDGRLGYANTKDVGDDETPGSAGPVDLGAGRTAVAISAGGASTCARLDDGSVRCWGKGDNGRLGYCDLEAVGDDEAPGSRGPVDLGAGGADCPGPEPEPTPTPTSATPTPTPAATATPDGGDEELRLALEREAQRARKLRECRRAAGDLPKAKRARARAACLKRLGRSPGRVGRVSGRAVSATRAVLSFSAVGSDGDRLPAARSYVVAQSESPIASGRDFRRAHALCGGGCEFDVSAVGAAIRLSVTHLRPGTRYFYAVAARDNVSDRVGRRSPTVKVRTPTRGAGSGARGRPRLVGRVRPRRDGRKPYQFTVTGRIKLPKGLSKDDGCTGQVTVKIARVRRGRDKTLSARRATVRDNCRFTHQGTFGERRIKRARGALRFVIRFQGNDMLKPGRIVRKAKFGHKR